MKVCITGATSGLGLALAELFAQKRWDLVLIGRNGVVLNEICRNLSPFVRVESFVVDFASAKEREQLIDFLRNATIDLLINNAGVAVYGRMLEHPLHRHLACVETNLVTPFLLMHAIAENWMKKGKRGTILNVSSIAAFFSIPYFGTYPASKAFMQNISRSFAKELEPSGIDILLFSPGPFKSAFCERASLEMCKRPPGYAMEVEWVAKKIFWQIEKKKPFMIANGLHRAMLILSRLLPKKWLEMRIGKKLLKRTASHAS